LVLCALLAVVFAVRQSEFGNLEPRQDHASFVQWVRGAVDATHVLPVRAPGESFRAAAERDTESLFNAVLRPIYAANIVLFKTFAFAVFYAGSELAGAAMPHQVALSILASLAACAIFAGLALAGTTPGSRAPFAWAWTAAAGLFLLANGFLHVFSALGDHNVGLMTIALLGWATMRLERHCAGRPPANRPVPASLTLPIAVAVFLATYANHTSLLLAAPAVGLVLIALPGLSWGRKIRAGLPAAAALALSLLPAAALLYVTLSAGYLGSREESFLGYADFAASTGNTSLDPIAGFAARAGGWLDGLLAIFGPVATVAAFAGLVGMALFDRLRFPLALLLVHLALASGMAAFASQSSRTIAYAVPVMCLGLGWAVARLAVFRPAVGRRSVTVLARAAAVAVAVLYLGAQAPALRDPVNAPFWGSYFRTQGGWGEIRSRIDAALPDGALLVPYDYDMSHLYGATRPETPPPVLSFSSVTSLVGRAETGTLGDYLDRRGLLRKDGVRLFVLAFEETSPKRDEDMRTIARAGAALFPGGYGGLEIVGTWRWAQRERTVVLLEAVRADRARPR
jgi:hypothetical protein